MRCTNKKKIGLLCVVSIASFVIAGCGKQTTVNNAYPAYQTDIYRTTDDDLYSSSFTEKYEICVTNDINFGLDKTDSELAEAAGVFNLTKREVTYSQNLFEQLYPASTTKIMTAYLALENCELEDIVTVSEAAVTQSADSSVCDLKAGDKITVEQLLYGLMLESGNDAAYALAEHISGSVEGFAELMNQTALSFGASHTHFVNPHGLPDEDHYTTVYDMYLIFQHAIANEQFKTIINTPKKEVTYKDKDDKDVTAEWKSTVRYLTGEEEMPEGITVIGGKTGTTNAAGYCLVLYSKNAEGDEIVSIVYKATGRDNLYHLMSQILEGFAK